VDAFLPFLPFYTLTKVPYTNLARALGFGHEWQQGQVTGSLDCHCQLALVLGARSGLPPRANLATVGQKAPQGIGPLVVDVCDFLFAEKTCLATLRETPPAILILIPVSIPRS
jgi:hypothetical protein